MNPERELENRNLQNEEMEALEAIFPEAFQIDTSSPNAFIYTLNLDEEEETELRSPRKLVLRFFLPPTYPNQDMPVYEISSIYCGAKKIDDDMIDAIDAGFQSLFQPTEVVLFEWISWLRDYLEENVEKSTIEVVEEIAVKLEQSTIKDDSSEQEEEEEIFDYNPEDYEYKKKDYDIAQVQII
jgi:hypothetical protein